MNGEPVWWERTGGEGAARTGVLHTPHGDVPTPAFMPVGTRATVRHLGAEDLEALGTDIMLANTYHLMLRPGESAVAATGGLHRFAGWERPMLTDSGGYQIFSLRPRVDEEGVRFRSSYDGSTVALSPERAVAVQEVLGADIAMTLDVPVALPATRPVVRSAMERTLRWGERSLSARRRDDRALFGIVQGGTDPELRRRSAEATAGMEVSGRRFHGFAIGGLAVGEPVGERNATIGLTAAALPETAPRYVMGLGDTDGLLDATGRGVDLFDCVIPTRLARHGKALHPAGSLSIRRAEWADSAAPLDERCGCPVCHRYPRAYLRHLFQTGEQLGPRLLTLHNLHHVLELMRSIREAIDQGRLAELRRRVVARRVAPSG